MSRNALNLNLLNYNMKILQVAFLLLFKLQRVQNNAARMVTMIKGQRGT